MKHLRLGLLSKELVLFGLIPVLALLASARYYAAAPVEKMSVGFSIPWFLISIAIATALILILIKFIKFKLPFQILMSLTIFIGSIVLFDAFMPSIYALITAATLVGLYWSAHNIMVHNLAIIISIAGVAAYLGLILPAIAILLFLGVVSVYDIIAVFKTKHMVHMFKSMVDRGAVLALIIPEKIRHVHKRIGTVDHHKSKHEVVFLGTGDAAFPSMLAVSALPLGLYPAIGVVIGALLGVVVVHFLLMKLQKPLPALPPIAALSAAGLLVGMLI